MEKKNCDENTRQGDKYKKECKEEEFKPERKWIQRRITCNKKLRNTRKRRGRTRRGEGKERMKNEIEKKKNNKEKRINRNRKPRHTGKMRTRTHKSMEERNKKG